MIAEQKFSLFCILCTLQQLQYFIWHFHKRLCLQPFLTECIPSNVRHGCLLFQHQKVTWGYAQNLFSMTSHYSQIFALKPVSFFSQREGAITLENSKLEYGDCQIFLLFPLFQDFLFLFLKAVELLEPSYQKDNSQMFFFVYR